jgi:hypothetical protein
MGAVAQEVVKLRSTTGDVVDDEVCHNLDLIGKGPDVPPLTQSAIDLGMIDGVKSRVCTIDWKEEGKQMHAAKESVQGTAQQCSQLRDSALAEPVDISDQVNRVSHQIRLCLRNYQTVSWEMKSARPEVLLDQTAHQAIAAAVRMHAIVTQVRAEFPGWAR